MRFLGRTELSVPIQTTINNYLTNYQRTDRNGIHLEIDGDANIAYNAFLIMTLINMPDYPNRDVLMKKLAEAICARQQRDGRFLTDYRRGGEKGIDYYAGESLLALVRLYYETGDKTYFNAVANAFSYYRDYWRNNKIPHLYRGSRRHTT